MGDLISTFLDALKSAFGFGEAISPAIIEWTEAKIPLEKQRVMQRRIHRLYKFLSKNPRETVEQNVFIEFGDLPPAQQEDITNILTTELKPTKIIFH